MKRNKLLPLFLVLALCLSPSALAARGETKVVVNGCFQITMDGFLRMETYREPYEKSTGDDTVLEYDEFTFYVVRDNSTVTVEAAPGYRYGTDFDDHEPGVARYAPTGYEWIETSQQFSGWGMGHMANLTGPLTYTVSPSTSDSFSISARYGIYWICERDFARLPCRPDRGDPKADSWADCDILRSFELGLFPVGIDPYEDDCTREMTRGEFATALFKLYQKLGGSVNNLSRNTPFPDLPGGDARSCIALAYQLGLVDGTGPTTFSPDDPLTREQAAVWLARLYEGFCDKLKSDDYYDSYFDYSEYTYCEDRDQISPWARSAVALLDERSIIRGAGNYWTFAPQKTLTLQEGMVMIQRTLDSVCFNRYWDSF